MHAFDYSFNMDNYMSKELFTKIKEFASDKKTPFVVTSLSTVAQKYDELKKSMPYADIYYAVKANPEEKVLNLLAERGSNFDIASVYELDLLLELGVSPTRISYGNPIKKPEDIRHAYERGVRLFATDSGSDIHKIAQNAQIAVRQSKAAINKGAQCDIKTGTAFEAQAFALCFSTEDQKDAMTAFVNKEKVTTYKNR